MVKDIEFDIAVGSRSPGNPTRETAKRQVIVQLNVGSRMLTPELQAKKVRSLRHCMHISEVVSNDIVKRLTA